MIILIILILIVQIVTLIIQLYKKGYTLKLLIDLFSKEEVLFTTNSPERYKIGEQYKDHKFSSIKKTPYGFVVYGKPKQ